MKELKLNVSQETLKFQYKDLKDGVLQNFFRKCHWLICNFVGGESFTSTSIIQELFKILRLLSINQ